PVDRNSRLQGAVSTNWAARQRSWTGRAVILSHDAPAGTWSRELEAVGRADTAGDSRRPARRLRDVAAPAEDAGLHGPLMNPLAVADVVTDGAQGSARVVAAPW